MGPEVAGVTEIEPVDLVMGQERAGVFGGGARVGVDVSREKEKRWDEEIGDGGLPRGALGVGADISPLCQHPGKNTNCWMLVCWSSVAPNIVRG